MIRGFNKRARLTVGKLDQTSNQEYQGRVEGLDNINNVPDALLCTIISLLPFNEAVATSLVSRRWRYLWQWVSRFQLDQQARHQTINYRRPWWLKYIRQLDHIITSSMLLNKKIYFCKLPHFSINYRILEKWIRTFLDNHKELKELVLVGELTGTVFPYADLHQFELPKGIFCAKNLLSLRLEYFKIWGASPFEGCVNLLTLKLGFVCLINCHFNEILCHCPRLENLILELDCSSNRDSYAWTICHDRLKSLEIRNIYVSDFEIRGKALTVLKLTNIRHSGCYVVDCPLLKELTVRHFNQIQVRNILESKKWEINGRSCSSTKDLRSVYTTLDLDSYKNNVTLANILKTWSNLETLDITSQTCIWTPGLAPCTGQRFWQRKQLRLGFSTYKLRIVKIREFRGKEFGRSFVTHILNNSPMLKQLTIDCHDECSKDDAANTIALLSIPKASTDARIVLKTGKWLSALDKA